MEQYHDMPDDRVMRSLTQPTTKKKTRSEDKRADLHEHVCSMNHRYFSKTIYFNKTMNTPKQNRLVRQDIIYQRYVFRYKSKRSAKIIVIKIRKLFNLFKHNHPMAPDRTKSPTEIPRITSRRKHLCRKPIMYRNIFFPP